MKEEIERRVVELEAEIKNHQEDYGKLPTVIVSKQGAVKELKKLLELGKD